MPTSLPLVTIITCVRNNEKFLPKCLRSVAAQDYPNIEHIIVEGHSNDNSLNLINKYIDKYPQKNIKLYIRPAKGIANALNFGIRHSSGKYIHIVHADDYYYSKTSIKRAVDVFKKHPGITWFVGNHLFDIEGKVLTLHNQLITQKLGKYLIWLLPWMSHQNMFYDISVYKNGGMYDEQYKNSLDYEQWLRLIKTTPIYIVDKSFSVFRIHKDSTTFNPKNLPRLLSENFKAVTSNLIPQEFSHSR